MRVKHFLVSIVCVSHTSFAYAEKPLATPEPVLNESAPASSIKPNDAPVTTAPITEKVEDEKTAPSIPKRKQSPKRSPKASPTYKIKKKPKRLAPPLKKKPLTEKQIKALEVVVEEGNKLPNLSDQDALHLQRIEEKLLRKEQAGVYLTPKEKQCVWRLIQYRPIQKALDYQEKTVLRRAMEDQAFQGGAAIASGIAGTIAAALTAWGVIAATTPADG
ncbi:MAG: hypothetical protein ACPG7U_00890 [Holosporaceae bacterium]